MFSAYTIRTLIPRLIIALIGINLSWFAMDYILQFTHILGTGIEELLDCGFNSCNEPDIPWLEGSDFEFEGIVPQGNIASDLSGTAIFILLAGAGAFAAFTSLAFAATVGLALLATFVIVLLRKILIFALIMSAPIAMVLWVLPNTANWAKTWWSWFSRALLMFPIIVAMIRLGQHLSGFVNFSASQGTAGFVESILGLLIYFLPYAAIPFTIRLAGGALSTIANFQNDQNRGIIDGARKVDQERKAFRQQVNAASASETTGVKKLWHLSRSGQALPRAGFATKSARERSGIIRNERLKALKAEETKIEQARVSDEGDQERGEVIARNSTLQNSQFTNSSGATNTAKALRVDYANSIGITNPDDINDIEWDDAGFATWLNSQGFNENQVIRSQLTLDAERVAQIDPSEDVSSILSMSDEELHSSGKSHFVGYQRSADDTSISNLVMTLRERGADGVSAKHGDARRTAVVQQLLAVHGSSTFAMGELGEWISDSRQGLYRDNSGNEQVFNMTNAQERAHAQREISTVNEIIQLNAPDIMKKAPTAVKPPKSVVNSTRQEFIHSGGAVVEILTRDTRTTDQDRTAMARHLSQEVDAGGSPQAGHVVALAQDLHNIIASGTGLNGKSADVADAQAAIDLLEASGLDIGTSLADLNSRKKKKDTTLGTAISGGVVSR